MGAARLVQPRAQVHAVPGSGAHRFHPDADGGHLDRALRGAEKGAAPWSSCATLLSSGQLIVGKLLPYLVISLAATTLILIAARVLFHVQVRGVRVALRGDAALPDRAPSAGGSGLDAGGQPGDGVPDLDAHLDDAKGIFLSGFIFSIRHAARAQLVTYAVPARYFPGDRPGRDPGERDWGRTWRSSASWRSTPPSCLRQQAAELQAT
ncbi:MAG: hypothetical protein U0610_08705 [bacterium]